LLFTQKNRGGGPAGTQGAREKPTGGNRGLVGGPGALGAVPPLPQKRGDVAGSSGPGFRGPGRTRGARGWARERRGGSGIKPQQIQKGGGSVPARSVGQRISHICCSGPGQFAAPPGPKPGA